MRKVLAFFGLAMFACACHKPAEPALSLKGTWKATGGQVTNCGTRFRSRSNGSTLWFRILRCSTRTVSSFDLQKAGGTGTVTMELHMEKARPITVEFRTPHRRNCEWPRNWLRSPVAGISYPMPSMAHGLPRISNRPRRQMLARWTWR